MSDRDSATNWVVLTLIAVVLIALIDAYDVFYFYATMQEMWAAHPLWLKVLVHAGSLVFLIWLLATRKRPRYSRRHTLVILAALLGVNLASTTRVRLQSLPRRVAVEVVSIPIDSVLTPEYYDVGSPCFRDLEKGWWHMVINGELLIVPRLPAPVEDHGVDMFVTEDHLCSRFFGDRVPPREPPGLRPPWEED